LNADRFDRSLHRRIDTTLAKNAAAVRPARAATSVIGCALQRRICAGMRELFCTRHDRQHHGRRKTLRLKTMSGRITRQITGRIGE